MPRTPSNRQKPRSRREIVVADPVRFYDGMPLAPQHFQESGRRVERLFDYHVEQFAPYHYGVVSIDLDGASLSAGILSVQVEAILPDRGVARTATAVTIPLDPAELQKKLGPVVRGRASTLDVYLSLPTEHAGRAAAGDDPRYLLPSDGDRITDDTTGTGEMEVHRLVPNVRITVDVDPPKDASWIQIAELRMEGEVFSRTDYVPPLLAVTEATTLFEMLRRMVENVRNIANRLGERISVLSPNTDAALIAESRRQLYHLTAALPPLEAVFFTRRAHPFAIYVALSSVIGHLAAIALSPVPPRPPAYQHDDLKGVFGEMEGIVQRMIREGIQQSFKAHPFDLDGQIFRLEFVSDWADRVVMLAVREARSSEPGSARRWLESAIVGPQRVARQLQASRALGVEREVTPRKDDLVPTSDEALFELKGLKRFFNADEPMVIWNPAPGSDDLRPVEVVLYVKERTEPL